LFTEDAEHLEELTKEVVAAYTEMREIFQKKDTKRLAAVSYNKEKRIAQQLYYTKKKSPERWEVDYLDDFNAEENIGYTMEPIENFRLVFYGNGRLVALERTDIQYRGGSALLAKYKNKKGEKRKSHYDFVLHRPKRGGKLESI
jgi:hypothetical protein